MTKTLLTFIIINDHNKTHRISQSHYISDEGNFCEKAEFMNSLAKMKISQVVNQWSHFQHGLYEISRRAGEITYLTGDKR